MSDSDEQKKNQWVILCLDEQNFGFVQDTTDEFLGFTHSIDKASRYSLFQAREYVESLIEDDDTSQWWILPDKNKGEFL